MQDRLKKGYDLGTVNTWCSGKMAGKMLQDDVILQDVN